MEMFDECVIKYRDRPLFQSAKMRSSEPINNTLEDVACFYYVVKGRNEAIEGNGLHSVNKNEGIIKSCGNFISRYMPDEDGSDFEAIVIFLYPDMIQEIYKDSLPKFNLLDAKALPPKTIVANELIQKFIDGLVIYFDNSELMDEELAQLKLKELIMILLRSNYFESVVDFFKGMFAKKKSSFREIIDNNLYNHLSMEQLAFLANRSLSSFKREFKNEFGDSPARYIKNKRLESAASRLLISDDSISSIAYDCGFQDITTFSAIFKDKFDISPSQYRLNQIGK